MKSQSMSFIIVWNVASELHSPKNMTVGSNSPQLVHNAAFHLSPSLIHTLLNPHQRSSAVKNLALWRWRHWRWAGVGRSFLLLPHWASGNPVLVGEANHPSFWQRRPVPYGWLWWENASICHIFPEESISSFCSVGESGIMWEQGSSMPEVRLIVWSHGFHGGT